MTIKNLSPKNVWNYFYEITQIPRPSGNETLIKEYLLNFAKRHELEAISDNAGNVLITKPATKGCEKLKTIILQGHVDMVCEKNNNVQHDFEKDPIETYIDGNWVKTRGTTLGADNGIGIAASLAILSDDKIHHGRIKCLFTTGEETGLIGANELSPNYLDGDILLNLDTEEEGEIYIGCAGGKITTAYFKYTNDKTPENYFWFEVKVSGLNGGHSGADIHKGLGNANKIINRYLWSLSQKHEVRLADIKGGNLHNAIAREAFAIVGIPSKDKENAIIELNILRPAIEDELKHIDPNVSIEIETTHAPKCVIDKKTTHNLFNSIYACPHGVIDMSFEIQGMVETSTNLASIKKTDEHIIITTSQRSSTESLKDNAVNIVKSVFNLANATIEESNGYPGWKPNGQSEILNIAQSSYKTLFGVEAKIKVIHAGLECGLFYKKNPNLDIISFGPTITDAHSPAEQVNIPSVEKWWKLLIDILEKCPQK